MLDLANLLGGIAAARARVPADQSVLVALTGIDGCGKGYVARRVADAILKDGLRPEIITVDGWLNLPERRFDPRNPAENFYFHALRFPEMFDQLIDPLRARRSVRVESDFLFETDAVYRRRLWDIHDVDVILLDGIFLLKSAFRHRYDFSCWIDCSFETALERAIARAQEGKSAEETREVYRTTFHAAQRIHLERDRPRGAASLVLVNDARLSAS